MLHHQTFPPPLPHYYITGNLTQQCSYNLGCRDGRLPLATPTGVPEWLSVSAVSCFPPSLLGGREGEEDKKEFTEKEWSVSHSPSSAMTSAGTHESLEPFLVTSVPTDLPLMMSKMVSPLPRPLAITTAVFPSTAWTADLSCEGGGEDAIEGGGGSDPGSTSCNNYIHTCKIHMHESFTYNHVPVHVHIQNTQAYNTYKSIYIHTHTHTHTTL